jgi:CRISPR system Cascade subunit CasD
MAEHLVFTLAATIASFGDVAGHERRGSWGWPGRSAILGLLAAAKGIRRDGDFAALDALAVSVAVFEGGQPLRDYHTVQTVPTTLTRRPQSRPEALARAGKDANTMITLRDYRTGVLFGVAVTGQGLQALADALRHPVFSLYLGRKSCPLSAPVAPRVVEAASAEAALAQVQVPLWHKGDVARLLYAEDSATGQTETRHDAPLDRQRWHFSARAVASRAVDIRPEAP